jgi:hypothetical protein
MSKNIKYEPITAICRECGKEFDISSKEQEYYHRMNYQLPKHCEGCRKVRKKQRREAEEREKNRIDAIRAQKKWERDEAELASLLPTLPYTQINLSDVQLVNPENVLFIIGNGFDLMHGVRSSYWNFQETLGKNSELRFHLETYLQSEELWCNFEDSLSHLNAGAMLNVMDMWLDNFGVYDEDDSMAAYYGAIDTAMLPIQVITGELPKKFRKWVESLEANGNKPLESLISKKATYLNFNYTDFLETLYGVPGNKIKYIHGCRKKVKYQPKEKLILGHIPNVDYLAGYKPARGMVPKYKDPWKRAMLERAMEIGKENWITYYAEAFTKHTPEIINENRSFFDGLVDKDDIVIIGHSLAEVDYPYIEEIAKCNKGKARWHIGYHSLDDIKRLINIVDYLRLSTKKVDIFRT